MKSLFQYDWSIFAVQRVRLFLTPKGRETSASFKSAETVYMSNCAKICCHLVIMKWLCPYVWIVKLFFASRDGDNPTAILKYFEPNSRDVSRDWADFCMINQVHERWSRHTAVQASRTSRLISDNTFFGFCHSSSKEQRSFWRLFPCGYCLKMSHTTKKKKIILFGKCI